MTDDEREAAIARHLMRMQSASCHKERHLAWREARDLINGRSPEQVARMEREKGLAG